MPYILRGDRDELAVMVGRHIKTPGELNYAITKLVTFYLNTHGLSYDTVGDIVNAMECAKLEFYRRVAAPYEDTKIEENGDVYGKNHSV